MNGIGGKSVILIRFNPDKVRHKKQIVEISLNELLETLIDIIKTELSHDYDRFIVKMIQLYYDDHDDTFSEMKIENITDLVCI